MSASKQKIQGTEQAWENRELGADEQYVRVSTEGDGQSIDEAAGLQPISIRLQKSLIDDLKMIAEMNGIGYQPLVRQVLKRFADAEKKKILQDKHHELSGDNGPSDQPEDDHTAYG